MMDVLPELPRNYEDQAALPRSCTNDTVKMANSSFDLGRLLGGSNPHLAILYPTSRNLPCTWAHIDRRFSTSRDVGLLFMWVADISPKRSALRCSGMGKILFLTSQGRSQSRTKQGWSISVQNKAPTGRSTDSGIVPNNDLMPLEKVSCYTPGNNGARTGMRISRVLDGRVASRQRVPPDVRGISKATLNCHRDRDSNHCWSR